MMTSLTLPIALDIAHRVCPTHRADILSGHRTEEDWARSRVELPGVAWAFVQENPVVIGGVLGDGPIGMIWIAGCDGWTRYVKHVLRMWKVLVSSGLYKRYICEVHEFDHIARRFVERVGFTELGASGGIVTYGVTP